MPDDNSNKNQDSRTQIILALIGLFSTVRVALITNWDKFFPSKPSASVIPSPEIRESTTSPLPSASASPLPSVSASPPSSADKTVQSAWQLIGTASTGESVFVDSSSIKKTANVTDFTYRIGGEVLVAQADCESDRWYVDKYGKWYSPSSQATQDMLSYVCR